MPSRTFLWMKNIILSVSKSLKFHKHAINYWAVESVKTKMLSVSKIKFSKKMDFWQEPKKLVKSWHTFCWFGLDTSARQMSRLQVRNVQVVRQIHDFKVFLGLSLKYKQPISFQENEQKVGRWKKKAKNSSNYGIDKELSQCSVKRRRMKLW